MTFYRVGEPLRTERLRLRHVVDADVEALLGWQSDAEVTRYLPYGPRDREQIAELVGRLARMTTLEHDGDRVVFAIEQGAGGRVIGELHFVLAHATGPEIELGWVLAADAVGQGYATEAATAVRDLAFSLGAHRIIALLHPDNTASARVCARLGLRQEAHFRRNFRTPRGEWEDTAVWAMLADDPR